MCHCLQKYEKHDEYDSYDKYSRSYDKVSNDVTHTVLWAEALHTALNGNSMHVWPMLDCTSVKESMAPSNISGS
jgi:hypothetical protein